MFNKLIQFIINEQLNNELLNKNMHLINSSTGTKTTPLHFACISDRTDYVSLLIVNGANVNAQNEYGETPLHWAVKSGNITSIKTLLDNSADINIIDADGNTILHWAVEYDHPDIVKLLIALGMKISSKNFDYETPLQIGKLNNSNSACAILKQNKSKKYLSILNIFSQKSFK